MDDIPALDLWQLIIDVLHSSSNQKQKDKQARKNLSRRKAFKKMNSQMITPVSQGYLELSNDDFVSSNVNFCHKGTMLYIFEVNEAVIKMIMKGRSPALRHVSQDPQGRSPTLRHVSQDPQGRSPTLRHVSQDPQGRSPTLRHVSRTHKAEVLHWDMSPGPTRQKSYIETCLQDPQGRSPTLRHVSRTHKAEVLHWDMSPRPTRQKSYIETCLQDPQGRSPTLRHVSRTHKAEVLHWDMSPGPTRHWDVLHWDMSPGPTRQKSYIETCLQDPQGRGRSPTLRHVSRTHKAEVLHWDMSPGPTRQKSCIETCLQDPQGRSPTLRHVSQDPQGRSPTLRHVSRTHKAEVLHWDMSPGPTWQKSYIETCLLHWDMSPGPTRQKSYIETCLQDPQGRSPTLRHVSQDPQGRSPTLRHVSRTHKAEVLHWDMSPGPTRQKSYIETCLQDPQGCSWLVVRQNYLGPQDPNQVRRIHQLADLLTKGNFTLQRVWGNTLLGILSSTSMWRYQKITMFFLPNQVEFKERVNKRLRMMLNRPPGDSMDDIDTHSLTWEYSWLRQCAQSSFLEKITPQNLHAIRNTDEKPTVKKLFDVTQRLIEEQRLEISGVSEICSATSTWKRLSLKNDEESNQSLEGKSLRILRLCIVSWESPSVPPIKRWMESQIGMVHAENWIESMENQWSSRGWWIQGTQRCTFSTRSKKLLKDLNSEPEYTSKEESSSCRWTTASCGDSQNERVCLADAIFVATCAKKFLSGHWSFLEPRSADRTRLYLELDLNRGSEFRTDLTNSWEIWQRKHEFHVKMMILQQTQRRNRELWNMS